MPPHDEPGLRSEIEALIDRGRRAVDDLTERQAAWRPAPDRWSILDCLEHLTRTADAYLPGVDQALERAEAAGGTTPAGPVKLGILERWFIGSMEPPPKRRFPAPRRTRPARRLGETPPVEATVAAFEASHRRIAEQAGRADRVDRTGRASRIRSPFFPILSFSLEGALRSIAAHGRRHLWQAEQVRADPGFPTS